MSLTHLTLALWCMDDTPTVQPKCVVEAKALKVSVVRPMVMPMVLSLILSNVVLDYLVDRPHCL